MTTPSIPPTSDKFGYLRYAVKGRRRRRRGLLDLVQFIDVALVFGLFFIAGTSLVLQPGVSVALPSAPFDEGETYNALILTLAQEGMVFFNDERTTLDGLTGIFRQAVHENPDARLLIEADNRVDHAMMVRIYNMAAEAGIRKVTLATRPQGPRS